MIEVQAITRVELIYLRNEDDRLKTNNDINAGHSKFYKKQLKSVKADIKKQEDTIIHR